MARMLNEYSKFHGYSPVVVTGKPIVRSRWTTGCNEAATGSGVLILVCVPSYGFWKPWMNLDRDISPICMNILPLASSSSMSTLLQTLPANFRLLYAAGALKIHKSQSTLFMHNDRSFMFDVYLFIQMERLGYHGSLGGIDALLVVLYIFLLLRDNICSSCEKRKSCVLYISLTPAKDMYTADSEDIRTWSIGSPSFSVKCTREYIDKSYLPDGGSETRWNHFLPKKINIFIWRALRDRLPTRWNLSRKGIDLDSLSCPICDSKH
ncbi:RNA-directed DNA polymerase, eukaryota [Tanacetum coccineum]